jgi:type VI secretion system protein ImpE
MDARQLFQQGDLDGALAAVKQQVRDNPATAAHRTFLFQLMSVLGDWSRALTQLNVAGDLDSSAIPMVQVYREALSCEALREQVFAGERSPLVFGDPTSRYGNRKWRRVRVDSGRGFTHWSVS